MKIIRDINTLVISMNRSSRQTSNKETVALNDMLGQIDLTDTYRTFHPLNTFFKCTWKILQDRSYVRPQNEILKRNILSTMEYF